MPPARKTRRVHLLLLDINPCTPPVYPLGLEVVAQAARCAGYEVEVFSATPQSTDYPNQIDELESYAPACLGLQIRNHDLGILGPGWPRVHEFYHHVVEHLRKVFPETPLVFGGAGFSIAPDYWLSRYRPDYGVVGAGECAIVPLLETILQGHGDTKGIPNVVRTSGGECLPRKREYVSGLRRIGRSEGCLAEWIERLRPTAHSIPWANIEVQRGCPWRCRFCIEPGVHGRRPVSKPIADVLSETRSLVDAGVREAFFCASEFNADREYSLALCRAIASTGIDRELGWWTYLCPMQVDLELVDAMRAAGCRSVSINAVHAHDRVLQALHCPHRAIQLESAVACLSGSGIDCRLTFLAGTGTESEKTFAALLDFVRRHELVSTISAGLACYPGLDLGDGFPSYAVPGSPVSYALKLSPEQLVLLMRFLVDTPWARLANGRVRDLMDWLSPGAGPCEEPGTQPRFFRKPVR